MSEPQRPFDPNRRSGAQDGGQRSHAGREDENGAAAPPVIPGIVLVVEDEPPLRELIVELLQDEGFSTLAASDGQVAVDLLEADSGGAIAVVLLDMMLPRLDGNGVLRHLAYRRNGQVPTVRPARPAVVAMSASTDYLARAREAGAEAVLPKPLDLDKLFALATLYCGAPSAPGDGTGSAAVTGSSSGSP